MKKFLFFLSMISLVIGLGINTVTAAPIWYLSPGIDPSGDNAFQSALSGLNLYEEDFNGYTISGTNINDITLGGVNIDFSLPDIGSSSAKIFWGSYGGVAGGQYGTVSGGALLNYNPSNAASNSIKFTFSGDLVAGFGIWVFDNGSSSIDSYEMIVEDLDGTTWTSSILDANPGLTAHIVEGFIGATLESGIQSVTVKHTGDTKIAFELDHLQVASSPVPEPATMLLLGSGIIGLAGFRRKRATRGRR